MRAWGVMMLLLAPLAVSAAGNITDNPNLRTCGTDADCVLIKGTCHDTAVNIAFKDEAAAYYRSQAKDADCPKRFWEAKEKVAQCKPLAGSEPDRPKGNKEYSAVMNNGTCAVVPRPKKMN